MNMTHTTTKAPQITALIAVPSSAPTSLDELLSAQSIQTQTAPAGNGKIPPEIVRHILLGSPGAVRQTIHLLHSLRYAETVLWSPMLTIEDELTVTKSQGEAMSLLRKQV